MAGLVPATPIILPPPYPPPLAGEGREGAFGVAGTSPATTPVSDSTRSKSVLTGVKLDAAAQERAKAARITAEANKSKAEAEVRHVAASAREHALVAKEQLTSILCIG